MDVSGIPALDVAIGLSFVFLVLSLVASAGQELLASVFATRAKTLRRGLEAMLKDTSPAPKGSVADASATDKPGDDLVYRLYAHPLIRALYRDGTRFGRTTLRSPAIPEDASKEDREHAAAVQRSVTDVRLPSYIAPRSFALTLLDTVAPAVAATDPSGRPVLGHDLVKQTRDAIAQLDIPSGVKHQLLALLDDARGDIDAFRRNLETWFDDTMGRVSGWYKRKTQLFILIFAVVVTVAMNANALTIGERLWHDDALRATLVAQAAKESAAGANARQRLTNAVNDANSVAKLGVPLGWAQGDESDPRHVSLASLKGWLYLLGGWLITILAVSLGAPFWFDALSRLSRLRGSGKPEAPAPATGQAKEPVAAGS